MIYAFYSAVYCSALIAAAKWRYLGDFHYIPFCVCHLPSVLSTLKIKSSELLAFFFLMFRALREIFNGWLFLWKIFKIHCVKKLLFWWIAFIIYDFLWLTSALCGGKIFPLIMLMGDHAEAIMWALINGNIFLLAFVYSVWFGYTIVL